MRLGPERLPTFVVIGAMKSGTTSMARALRAHPEVFLAKVKEVRFFTRHYDLGTDWYRAHFAGADGAVAVGEATPSYLADPAVPARMADDIPEARLVAMLRNPVDRAYSHYWMNRALGGEKRGFSDAVEAESRGEGSPYLGMGRYREQLERFSSRFGRDRLLVLVFEDFARDPGPPFSEVCRFVGIDDRPRPRELHERANRYVTFRSLRGRRLAKRLPGVLGKVAGRLVTRKRSSYPPMEEAFRRTLIERIEDQISALEAWLDADLSIWRR